MIYKAYYVNNGRRTTTGEITKDDNRISCDFSKNHSGYFTIENLEKLFGSENLSQLKSIAPGFTSELNLGERNKSLILERVGIDLENQIYEYLAQMQSSGMSY